MLAVAAAVTFLFSALLDTRGFWSHEKFYTYIRADQVAKELDAGHFPQTFPDAVYGAGFAFPRFYPPVSLWLSAGLALAFDDAIFGTNIAFFLSVLASGLAMYFMVAMLARDRWLALGASLIYVSVPYRFVDVFVRGALAEAWTFVWYPIILAGLWRALTRRTLPWYLPAAVAALVLTHNITAVYFLGFCALFCALGLVWSGWRATLVAALGLALGLGLAAWFLVPQQYYLRSVWVGDSAYMWADAEHVHAHRVMPHQLFYSWPATWFGESHGPGYRDDMSFELGVGQLLVIPLAVFVALGRARARGRRDRRLLIAGCLCLAGWLASVAFMLYPRPLLVLLPSAFAYIQFSWRMLGLAAFLSAAAIALFARAGGFSPRVRYAVAAAGVAIVLLVPSFQREALVSPEYTKGTILAPAYVREEGKLGFTVLGEYLPREMDVAALYDGRLGPADFERPRLSDGAGAAITSWHRSGLDMEATVEGGKGATVVFPLAYYDFYRAEGAGGKRLETFAADGMLAVRVPADAGSVAIRQVITPVSKAGFAASLLALLATAACSLLLGRRARARSRLLVFRAARSRARIAAGTLDAEQAAGTLDGRG